MCAKWRRKIGLNTRLCVVICDYIDVSQKTVQLIQSFDACLFLHDRLHNLHTDIHDDLQESALTLSLLISRRDKPLAFRSLLQFKYERPQEEHVENLFHTHHFYSMPLIAEKQTVYDQYLRHLFILRPAYVVVIYRSYCQSHKMITFLANANVLTGQLKLPCLCKTTSCSKLLDHIPCPNIMCQTVATMEKWDCFFRNTELIEAYSFKHFAGLRGFH